MGIVDKTAGRLPEALGRLSGANRRCPHEVYADVRNDTLAVRRFPSVLLGTEGPDQLSQTGRDNRWDLTRTVRRAGRRRFRRHLDREGPELIVPADRWWDMLAISAALATVISGRHPARGRWGLSGLRPNRGPIRSAALLPHRTDTWPAQRVKRPARPAL